MKYFLTYLFLLSILSCSTPSKLVEPAIKEGPEHKELSGDPTLDYLVKEYKRLAKEHGVEFDDIVTIGFRDINISSGTGRVIGECTRSYFREIDIDKEFWDHASWISKVTLVFHELNHCYCTRDHDWGPDVTQVYPEAWLENLINHFQYYTPMYKTPDGFYGDNCPLSIMNPWIVEDRCINSHYPDYVQEMFQRCDPW